MGVSMFNHLRFDGKWRSYQQNVLNRLQKHLSDEKLHIVAAPGAGKTILGLEVIRRIGKKCLILAPTITIKNQWELRLKQLFLTDTQIASQLISMDILSPKTITISTYQGLLAGLCGHKEENDVSSADIVANSDIEETDTRPQTKQPEKAFARLNSKKAQALIQKLKDANIDLLCFDEAHHLRKEWWKALDYIMEHLKPSTTLSLTATPPYDVDFNEWKRYEKLCGPIDECISIPELVKNGDLCPHQDLIYFAPLRKEEEQSHYLYQDNALSFYTDFLEDKDMPVHVFHLDVWKNPRQYIENIFDDPKFYIALASYLNYHQFTLPKAFCKLFDTQQKALPTFDLMQAECLLNKLIFNYADRFPDLHDFITLLHQKAQKHHLIYHHKIYLTGNPKLMKNMARSLGKLDAISQIVLTESQQLQDKLRLVVLADYIKSEAFTSTTQTLGVIPIFMQLAKLSLPNIFLGVLTGKIIILPQCKKEALISLMESVNISTTDIAFKKLTTFPQYVEVKPAENIKSKIVHLITRLFNGGDLNILIGTQALLGEGWDAPAVNSLILSSTVASYMLSNQMRGRAIRIEKGNPLKVSHIWHLVSVQTYSIADRMAAWTTMNILENDEADFNKVKRRFDGYEAPTLYKPYQIQNGIERCLFDKLDKFYQNLAVQDYLKQLTQKMLSYSRETTRQAWESGLFDGTGMGTAHLKIGLKTPIFHPKAFTYIDGFAARLASACVIPYVFLQNISGRAPIGWNMSMLTLGIGGFVALMLPATLRLIRTGRPDGILKQISLVILETLFEMNIISTNPKMSSLVVHKTTDGYYISADTLSLRDNNIFMQSLSEFLNPIENARYLLVRKNAVLRFLKQVDYYAIPSIIGLNKKNVLLFKKIWQRRIGFCNIIYTRTIKGRNLLLKARVKAYSNIRQQTQQSNRWE